MLAGFNNKKLSRYNGVNDEYIFFVQRWSEILESKILDMYQYNILNSCVACDELFEVVEKTMEGLFTARQNVDDCKAEALCLVKDDFILEKHNRPIQITLLRVLGSKIDSKSKTESFEEKNSGFYTSLNRLKFQLKSPLKHLKAHYIDYILLELKDAIDANDFSRTNKCIGILASQCIFQGWSTVGLAKLLEIFKESEKTSIEKWNKFCKEIKAATKDAFDVYYSIKIETKEGMDATYIKETITSMGLVLKDGQEIISSTAGASDLSTKISSESSYLLAQIQATDFYSSVLHSINLLNSKLSIATFYNVINPWITISPQIVAHNTTKNQSLALRLTDIFRTYDYVDSNNSVFSDTNVIFSDTSKAEIMSKLNAVFSYTNLSRSSIFQETKYISLWIALESVMRTGQYSDIITHIKTVLPEILSIRYIYRIIRNFSEDCMRCNFKICDELSLDFTKQDKKGLVKEIISIFRDDAQYEILKNKCIHNKLLLYRCEEIHELLNDKNNIKQKLDHYTNKIRWHIQRLYRIRNEITHSAFNETKSLVIYIEHLYTYLSQLMSEIVFYVVHKEVESVEEAYATIPEIYKTYYEMLESGNLTVCEILPNGIIELD